MTIAERLKELGIILPPVNAPSGTYIPATAAGKLLFAAGQVPRINGIVRYTGKMGDGATMEDAYEGARICAINLLSAVQEAAGGLDNVERILKVNGYINAAPDFTDTPKVLNGASDLLVAVFGERGRHARSAIGVQELPGNAIVEVEMIVLLQEPRDYP